MHGRLTSITQKFNKDKLLGILRKNRDEYKELYEEAKNGYIEQAMKRVVGKMELLRNGKAVALQFSLQVPEDYSSTYETAIQMLSMSEDEDVVLNSQEFRNLVMNEWDWMDSWLCSNRSYSGKVQTLAVEKGLD